MNLWADIAELKLWAEREIENCKNWGHEEWWPYDNSTAVKFSIGFTNPPGTPNFIIQYSARAYELDPDGNPADRHGDSYVRLI